MYPLNLLFCSATNKPCVLNLLMVSSFVSYLAPYARAYHSPKRMFIKFYQVQLSVNTSWLPKQTSNKTVSGNLIVKTVGLFGNLESHSFDHERVFTFTTADVRFTCEIMRFLLIVDCQCRVNQFKTVLTVNVHSWVCLNENKRCLWIKTWRSVYVFNITFTILLWLQKYLQ